MTKIGIVIAFTHQTANHLIANPLSESPEILIISCIVEFVQGRSDITFVTSFIIFLVTQQSLDLKTKQLIGLLISLVPKAGNHVFLVGSITLRTFIEF